MNRELPRLQDTSKAEKEFFVGGKTLTEHAASDTRPMINMPEAPRPTQAEIKARKTADQARHIAEAELKVQAWFDTGRKPAEHEAILKTRIENLEHDFEEMEPTEEELKDKENGKQRFNERTEKALDELNATKAELTVLQRRLEEAKLPSIVDASITPLETGADQALGRQSGETQFVPSASRNKVGGASGEVEMPLITNAPLTEASKMDTEPAAAPSGGWMAKVKSWFAPKPAAPQLTAPQIIARRMAVRQATRDFFSVATKGAKPPEFDQAAYDAKAVNYKTRVAERKNRKAGQQAEKKKEVA